MHILNTALKILLFTAVFCILACQDAADSKPENKIQGSKVLKDYVKTPLDKAKLADKMGDRHNRRLNQALDDLE